MHSRVVGLRLEGNLVHYIEKTRESDDGRTIKRSSEQRLPRTCTAKHAAEFNNNLQKNAASLI